MPEIHYRTMDKSDWGPGPWQDEPDKIQWKDEATGFPCLIKRNHYGALCGYVGVASDHALYETHHDAFDADVHGGLTFSDHCEEGPEAETICHIPEPGEPDDVWWLGFDCGHYMDFHPSPVFPGIGTYRNVEYVRAEVAQLARQLAEL